MKDVSFTDEEKNCLVILCVAAFCWFILSFGYLMEYWSFHGLIIFLMFFVSSIFVAARLLNIEETKCS
jgi:CHASE2 domain-containing sensor protein